MSEQGRQFRVLHENCMRAGKLPSTLTMLNHHLIVMKDLTPNDPIWPQRMALLADSAKNVARHDSIQSGPLFHVRRALNILSSTRVDPSRAHQTIQELAKVSADFSQPRTT